MVIAALIDKLPGRKIKGIWNPVPPYPHTHTHTCSQTQNTTLFLVSGPLFRCGLVRMLEGESRGPEARRDLTVINRPFNNSCATWVAILIQSLPSPRQPPSNIQRGNLHTIMMTWWFTVTSASNTLNVCELQKERHFLKCSNCISGGLYCYFGSFKSSKRRMLKTTATTLTQTCAHSLTDGLVNWNINYCTALARVWEAPEPVCTCWSCRIWLFGELLTCRRKRLMLHSFRTTPEGIVLIGNRYQHSLLTLQPNYDI